MPVIEIVELNAAQKKRLLEELKYELSLCETEEDLEMWSLQFEYEKKQLLTNDTDDLWKQTIEQEMEKQQQLIKIKEKEYANSTIYKY